MSKPTVHIIGSGISGLRCAEIVLDSGLDVKIYKKSERIGGRMKTDIVDGFLLDRGFHVMQTGYPHSISKIDFESLGSEAFSPGTRIIKTVNGRPKITTYSDPFRRPLSSLRLLGSERWSDLIGMAKLRLSLSRMDIKKIFSGGDASTYEYLRQSGLSNSFIDKLLRPLFAGIFLESKLDTNERLFRFIFSSMSRGDMVLPRKGVGAYPNHLAKKIGLERISLSTSAFADDPTTIIINGQRKTVDQVVVAHPPQSEEKSMRMVWTVYFDSPRSPAPGKFLLLNGDYQIGKTAIAHMAVPSDVQPSYAPEGRSLVVATIVGDAADSLNLNNAEAVESRARKEIEQWFPDCKNWKTLDVQHIKAALPSRETGVNLSFSKSIGEDGIITCGDHMTHASMQGAVNSAETAANEAIRRIQN